MHILKIVLSVLCIVLSGSAGVCFLLSRRLLKRNGEKEVGEIMPKVERLLKTLEIILYLLVSSSALFGLVSILEGIIA